MPPGVQVGVQVDEAALVKVFRDGQPAFELGLLLIRQTLGTGGTRGCQGLLGGLIHQLQLLLPLLFLSLLGSRGARGSRLGGIPREELVQPTPEILAGGFPLQGPGLGELGGHPVEGGGQILDLGLPEDRIPVEPGFRGGLFQVVEEFAQDEGDALAHELEGPGHALQRLPGPVAQHLEEAESAIVGVGEGLAEAHQLRNQALGEGVGHALDLPFEFCQLQLGFLGRLGGLAAQHLAGALALGPQLGELIPAELLHDLAHVFAGFLEELHGHGGLVHSALAIIGEPIEGVGHGHQLLVEPLAHQILGAEAQIRQRLDGLRRTRLDFPHELGEGLRALPELLHADTLTGRGHAKDADGLGAGAGHLNHVLHGGLGVDVRFDEGGQLLDGSGDTQVTEFIAEAGSYAIRTFLGLIDLALHLLQGIHDFLDAIGAQADPENIITHGAAPSSPSGRCFRRPWRSWLP